MLFVMTISFSLSESFSGRIEMWEFKSSNMQKFKIQHCKSERTIYFIIIIFHIAIHSRENIRYAIL